MREELKNDYYNSEITVKKLILIDLKVVPNKLICKKSKMYLWIKVYCMVKSTILLLGTPSIYNLNYAYMSKISYARVE